VEQERQKAAVELSSLDHARRRSSGCAELADAAAGEVDSLKQELDLAHTRLQTLETERQVAERIIRQYGTGVCLLQGSYMFADESGRPARLLLTEDGRVERDGDGGIVVDADSDGPVHKVEFYGTGFLVDQTGLILTNRHLAQPWWSDDDAEALQKLGFTPRLVTLRAFFPRQEGPFEVKVERHSEEVDLAWCAPTCAARSCPRCPGARVRQRGARPAGGAAGLSGRAGGHAGQGGVLGGEADPRNARRQLRPAHGGAGQPRLIRPSSTQGHIGDVTKSDIVFDAATSQGGSGGRCSTAGRSGGGGIRAAVEVRRQLLRRPRVLRVAADRRLAQAMSAPSRARRGGAAGLRHRGPDGHGLAGSGTWRMPVVLAVVAALFRLPWLGNPPVEVFDEVYHAKSALQYLQGVPPTDWVHPPTAKLLIAVGVWAFGYNSWAWRLMPALAGIALAPVFYLLARQALPASGRPCWPPRCCCATACTWCRAASP
jgi:hypothetical protein